MDSDLRPRGPAPVPQAISPHSTAGTGRLLGLLRGVLLAVLVFMVAAVIGGLLAGTAPAGEQPARRPAAHERPVATATPAAGDTAAPPVHAARVQELGASMVYTGVVALGVSLTGTVIVLRRRRLW